MDADVDAGMDASLDPPPFDASIDASIDADLSDAEVRACLEDGGAARREAGIYFFDEGSDAGAARRTLTVTIPDGTAPVGTSFFVQVRDPVRDTWCTATRTTTTGGTNFIQTSLLRADRAYDVIVWRDDAGPFCDSAASTIYVFSVTPAVTDVVLTVTPAELESDCHRAPVPGDFDGDGCVTDADLAAFDDVFGTCGACCDVDGSGATNVLDFTHMLNLRAAHDCSCE